MLKEILPIILKFISVVVAFLFYGWMQKKDIEDDLEDVQQATKTRDATRDNARTGERDKRLQKFDID